MFETYRMLGKQQEAQLIREAEKLARGAAVSRGRRRRRGRDGARAVVTALSYIRVGRPAVVDAMEDGRRSSGRNGTPQPLPGDGVA